MAKSVAKSDDVADLGVNRKDQSESIGRSVASSGQSIPSIADRSGKKNLHGLPLALAEATSKRPGLTCIQAKDHGR